MSRLSKFLPYLLLFGLLTPLIFGKELLFPFIVHRTYFFYVVVDLALLLWLWQGGGRELRHFRHSCAAMALAFFLFVKLVSDLVGENSWSSVWSDYERMMGWFTWLHIGLYILLLASVFPLAKYQRVIKVAVAVAALVALYGLLQQAGAARATADPRLFSTIGNPAFLAGFLLLSGFWAGLLIWQEPQRWRQWWWAAVAMIIVLALLLTATRGALIGAYAGALILTGYVWYYGRRQGLSKRRRQLVGGAFLGLLLTPLLVLTLAQTSLAARSLALRRLGSISLTDQSAQSRLFLWRGAWTGIKERPFLGSGEYHIRLVLDRLYDPRIFEKWFDSSHNIIIDLALAHGLLGLAAGGGLIFVMGRALYVYRRTDWRAAGIGLSLLVAYLVQGQFIFDTLVGVLPLAVLAAFCIRTEIEGPVTSPKARESGQTESSWSNYIMRTAVLLFFLTAWLWYYQGWQALAAVTAGHRIIERGGSVPEAVSHFERGLAQARFGYTSLAALVRSNAVRAIQAANAKEQLADQALLAVVEQAHALARVREPATSQQFIDEAKVYLAVQPRPPELAARAEALFKTAIELSPARADTYYALAQLYVDDGRLAAADELLAPLFDRFGRERIEVSREIAWRRAQIARARHDSTGAAEQLALAVDYGILRSLAEFEPFVAQAITQKNWPAAKTILELMLMVDPNYDRALANLAQVHRELGEIKEARDVAERLQILHPETEADVEAFLQTLFHP